MLAEDSSAYEYDTVFDTIKDRQEQAVIQRRGESRYIGSLLAKADDRKRQTDLVYEKKLQRELEAENELFGETEAFVTPAYKEQLEQNRQYEEEQRRQDAADEKRQALGKKDMTGFYSNLLTKNVAFGGQEEKSAGSNSDREATRPSDNRLSDSHRRSSQPRYSEEDRQRAMETREKTEAAEAAKRESDLIAKYAKRNVGEAFENARQRYFQRVAAKKGEAASN